ncbi:MAG: ferritin-like domain-containing protein [Verrucomicrobiota bacterium]
MKMQTFDYQKWNSHFESNRLNRAEPDWSAPMDISPATLRPLLRSIEEFQLGDGGGPASLIAFDAERFRGSSENVRALVDAWFAEEREHSRLLGCAVARLGGHKISGHWSFTAFCWCRRILGVKFELQILLLTELVSTAYYRVLRRHVPDAPLAAMCGLILRDESGHVAFHRDRLAATPMGLDGLFGAMWEMQFWFCGHAAATVLWMSHGECLRAIGGSRAEYFSEVRYQLARFVRSLAYEKEPYALPTAVAVNDKAILCAKV